MALPSQAPDFNVFMRNYLLANGNDPATIAPFMAHTMGEETGAAPEKGLPGITYDERGNVRSKGFPQTDTIGERQRGIDESRARSNREEAIDLGFQKERAGIRKAGEEAITADSLRRDLEAINWKMEQLDAREREEQPRRDMSGSKAIPDGYEDIKPGVNLAPAINKEKGLATAREEFEAKGPLSQQRRKTAISTRAIPESREELQYQKESTLSRLEGKEPKARPEKKGPEWDPPFKTKDGIWQTSKKTGATVRRAAPEKPKKDEHQKLQISQFKTALNENIKIIQRYDPNDPTGMNTRVSKALRDKAEAANKVLNEQVKKMLKPEQAIPTDEPTKGAKTAPKAKPAKKAGAKTVKRRGKTPDGRAVIQYSDGTISYAD